MSDMTLDTPETTSEDLEALIANANDLARHLAFSILCAEARKLQQSPYYLPLTNY